MKKTIAILLALLLCASLIAVPAMGAQDQIAVVAKVPSDWVDPCAWAWDANGNNAFAAWPGELMEDLGDGWYYIYVPAGMTGIIINGNGGSVQTLDGAMDGDKNAWITVGENVEGNKYALTVSYEKQNTAEIPAPEGTVEPPTTPPTPETTDTYTVHVKVPASWTTANLWAWAGSNNVFSSWPGQAMNLGDDGWYTWDVPAWATNVIVNNGTAQTADIAVEARDLWLVVADDNSYTLSYEAPGADTPNPGPGTDKPVEDETKPNEDEKPGEEETKPGEEETKPEEDTPPVQKETITVHAYVPESWMDPCVWAWDDAQKNAFDAWPGELMTKDGDWYTLEVPAWICNVIINGNGGSVQTADLAVEAGKDLWIVVFEDRTTTVLYEEPAELPEPPVPTEPETPPTDPVQPTEPAAKEEPKEDGNGGLIAGIVIGIAGVGGSVGAVVASKKKKAAAQEEAPEETGEASEETEQ